MSPPNIESELKRLSESSPQSRTAIDRTLETLSAIARTRPNELVPYIPDVAKLLDSTADNIRAGSLETLAILSKVSPGAMAFLLPRLHDMLVNEPQNVIANQAIEILTNYAKTGKKAAEKVIPIFASSIDRLGVRNAAKVLNAMRLVVGEVPGLARTTLRVARRFEHSIAASLRSAASKLMSAIER